MHVYIHCQSLTISYTCPHVGVLSRVPSYSNTLMPSRHKFRRSSFSTSRNTALDSSSHALPLRTSRARSLVHWKITSKKHTASHTNKRMCLCTKALRIAWHFAWHGQNPKCQDDDKPRTRAFQVSACRPLWISPRLPSIFLLQWHGSMTHTWVEKQMKSKWDEVKSRERRCNSAKVRRKKIHTRQMLEKSRIAVFFQWFVVPMSKNCTQKCTKHVSFVPLFEVPIPMSKNCTPLWPEAHFQVKMWKTRQGRITFWSSDVEKLYAAVARSAFWSQNAKKLRVPKHFLTCRCPKIALCCDEKHISKWKCAKHIRFGPHFGVPMPKNCTPLLWREASRSTFSSQNVQSDGLGALFQVPMSKNCTPLWREAHVYKIRMFLAHFL